jgi:alkanesulfonate monooxygenase SsuD/methylene tetrahydromethanopterin reductase-like flavin-dependent oxidoreductase (luciferase family)
MSIFSQTVGDASVWARQEEQIEMLRRLFTEPVADFSGRFHRIDRASLVPKPKRSTPIWLGGSGEKGFDRATKSYGASDL